VCVTRRACWQAQKAFLARFKVHITAMRAGDSGSESTVSGASFVNKDAGAVPSGVGFKLGSLDVLELILPLVPHVSTTPTPKHRRNSRTQSSQQKT